MRVSIQKFLRSSLVLPSSLQFRLTLELISLTFVSVTIVTVWSTLQIERTLVEGQKQTLSYIASRFPEQVELYRQAGIEMGIQHTIDKLSQPGLLIWVKGINGQILTRPSGVNMTTPDWISWLNDRSNPPFQPALFFLNDRYAVWCANPLMIDGKSVGNVYFLQDITDDQKMLQTGVQWLIGINTIVMLVFMLLIAQRIRRALRPLAEMSQAASKVSVEDLQGNKLELQKAPTEILGLVSAFNEMLNRLSLAWEQQRQFVGNVSHELRTPLTVILGYLQSLLRHSEGLSHYQQQAIVTASSEAERTIRMLEDLLDLARIHNHNLHFRADPIILNTFVMEVAQMSQQVSHRKIHLDLPPLDIVICGDQDRLQQVLINIIDNAFKYSNPDQPVDLKLERKDDLALIQVHDRGIGIPLTQQQRIFERFYRVDEGMTRSRDGTGLGLAIAKSFIEGMGGRIQVRSKPGEGSTFIISLPLWN